MSVQSGKMRFWAGMALVLAASSLTAMSASAQTEAEGDVATEVENVDRTEETAANRSKWDEAVKTKYSLTDAQIQSLRDKGLKGPQIGMTAALAQASGKTVDEVAKMRTEDKMGWGKIAKTLGVEPKTIGQSVRETRHAIRDERREQRDVRKGARREARDERKNERREARDSRKQERRETREKRRGN